MVVTITDISNAMIIMEFMLAPAQIIIIGPRAYFEYILSIQDLNMAMRARVITEKFLEYMEQKYGIIQDEDEQFDNFREWYRNGQSENDVEELDKEEEMFLNWFDGYYTS